MPDVEWLRRMAETEFFNLVRSTVMVRNKLRLDLVNGPYIDFWWSSRAPGRYAYHWERGHIGDL